MFLIVPQDIVHDILLNNKKNLILFLYFHHLWIYVFIYDHHSQISVSYYK